MQNKGDVWSQSVNKINGALGRRIPKIRKLHFNLIFFQLSLWFWYIGFGTTLWSNHRPIYGTILNHTEAQEYLSYHISKIASEMMVRLDLR